MTDHNPSPRSELRGGATVVCAPYKNVFRQINQGIGRTPHEATFGCRPHLGLRDTRLPSSIRRGLETEEDLREALGGGSPAGQSPHQPDPPDPSAAAAGPSRRPCIVCTDAVDGDDHCRVCIEAVHARPPCSSAGQEGPICALCTREQTAAQERHSAQLCQQRQAEKMLRRAGDAARELQIGTNVRVGIPDVDRARNQQRNIIGVVMEVSKQCLLDAFACGFANMTLRTARFICILQRRYLHVININGFQNQQ